MSKKLCVHNLKWLKPVSNNNQLKAQAKVQRQGALTMQHSSMEAYSGALPHPDHLERFEKIMPGISARIMNMAEKEGDHRRAQETLLVEANVQDMKLQHENIARGQRCAFWISIAGLMVSAMLVYSGQHLIGASLGGGVITALAATFIIGRSSKSADSTAGGKK